MTVNASEFNNHLLTPQQISSGSADHKAKQIQVHPKTLMQGSAAAGAGVRSLVYDTTKVTKQGSADKSFGAAMGTQVNQR